MLHVRPSQHYEAVIELTWNYTVSRRVAWTGIILTILLPIVACQFIYLPVIALPAWKTEIWDVSLSTDETLNQMPSVYVSPGAGVTFLNLSSPNCSWSGQNCTVIEDSVDNNTTQYFLFVPFISQPTTPPTLDNTVGLLST
jgi:hypothetical protein